MISIEPSRRETACFGLALLCMVPCYISLSVYDDSKSLIETQYSIGLLSLVFVLPTLYTGFRVIVLGGKGFRRRFDFAVGVLACLGPPLLLATTVLQMARSVFEAQYILDLVSPLLVVATLWAVLVFRFVGWCNGGWSSKSLETSFFRLAGILLLAMIAENDDHWTVYAAATILLTAYRPAIRVLCYLSAAMLALVVFEPAWSILVDGASPAQFSLICGYCGGVALLVGLPSPSGESGKIVDKAKLEAAWD